MKEKGLERSSYALLVLSMAFVSVLIASNVIACKLTQLPLPQWSWLGPWRGEFLQVDCALFLFPLTYVISDIINEVYGLKVSRGVIWGGMLCTIAFSLMVYWSIQAEPSPYWNQQEAYALTLSASMRIFGASLVAYFLGEFLNALAFHRIKQATGGRFFVLRALLSTLLGNVIDTTAFCLIAFLRDIPPHELLKMILLNVVAKSSVELLLMPGITRVVRYCQRPIPALQAA